MNTKKKRISTRSLVVIGMMAALTVVMTLTPLGFLRLPVISITLLHLPTIIVTLIEGPWVGLAVGFMFGLASWYNAATTAGVLNVFFLNPLISVFPRLFIAPVTYLVWKGVKRLIKKTDAPAIGIAAVAGTLTNTAGVLGLLYIVYASKIAQQLIAVAGDVAGKFSVAEAPLRGVALFLWSIVATNAIPECIVAVVAAVPIVTALRHVRRAAGRKSPFGKE